jgi:hypothetical protein
MRCLGAIAIAALTLSACADPQLTLDFVIQKPYRDAVYSVDLQLLAPPLASPYSCDDIAFGRVDMNALTLTKVGEIQSSTLQTPFNGVNRTAHKIFVADGFDMNKKKLVSGCLEVGEVKSNAELQIMAEPIAHVTVPSGPLKDPVSIPVMDLLAMPLAGVKAVWSVDGAGGAGSNGEATSDGSGTVTLNPDLPTRAGPFVLDVRVRWADGPPVLLKGFVRPTPFTRDLGTRALAYVSGAFGSSMKKGVAVLFQNATADSIGFLSLSGGQVNVTLSSPISTSAVLGMIDGGGQKPDRVIAVGAASWDEATPSTDGTMVTLTKPPSPYTPAAGTTLPARILTDGACGDNDRRVLIQYAEDIFAVYHLDASTDGGPFRLNMPTDPPVDIVATGCMSTQDGSFLRTWAVSLSSSFGIELLSPGPPALGVIWLAPPDGIVFSRPIGNGGRSLVFGTQISVNDFVVTRASFVHENDMLKLVVEGTDTISDIPSHTAAGDIDNDGVVDAVSLFQRTSTVTTDMKDAMWAVLGRVHGTQRISGDVDLDMPPLRNPTVLLADMDGDGSDDIVIGEITDQPGDTAARVFVYPMGH